MIPLPELLRPLEAEDVALVNDVFAASVEHDGVAPLDESALLDVDALRGSIVALDGGFALVRDTELDLVVAPAERGRGVGTKLLVSVFSGGGGRFWGGLTAWSHADDPAAAALASSFGFARVRSLWVMRLDPLPSTPAVTLPDGVTIRPYVEADLDALVELNRLAFAHHPEQGAMTRADFEERMSQPWFDPAGLLLAVSDTHQVLGFHWTKLHGKTSGEVYVVGVSPDAQGLGLGSALTQAGLAHLESVGATSVHLYVEADNAPAIAVYTKLGFTHADADTHVQYRRDPDPS